MDNIKIIKLQNGEDIIGTVTSKGDLYYDVEEPMAFHVDYRNRHSGLVMKHWLPVQLLKKNEIQLKSEDILSILEPAEDFCEYYINTVEKIKELLKAKNLVDGLDDEEINEIMDAYEELQIDGNTLH